MSDRPIRFSGPMIRALLEGRKTQTRRVVKPQPEADAMWSGGYRWTRKHATITRHAAELHALTVMPLVCPYGQPGDLLWVRETWASVCKMDDNDYFVTDKAGEYVEETWYRADGQDYRYIDSETDEVFDAPPWKPSIHMPRALSRLTLRITDVQGQRLEDINGLDAMAEGLVDLGIEGARWHWERNAKSGHFAPWRAYRALWESINGPGSWDANPWVWALTFEVIKANVDQAQP